MWIHLFAAALAAIGAAGLLAAQEQILIDLPGQVVLDGSAIGGSSELSRPVAVRFSQALLAPGRAFRLSVRSEGGTPGCWLFFTTTNARGGIGRSGRIGENDFVPVFEGLPWASSGGFEISWALSSPREARQAGQWTTSLRWRIESVPSHGSREHGPSAGGNDSSARGIAPPDGQSVPGKHRPRVSALETPDRQDRRRPPAEEVP